MPVTSSHSLYHCQNGWMDWTIPAAFRWIPIDRLPSDRVVLHSGYPRPWLASILSAASCLDCCLDLIVDWIASLHWLYLASDFGCSFSEMNRIQRLIRRCSLRQNDHHAADSQWSIWAKTCKSKRQTCQGEKAIRTGKSKGESVWVHDIARGWQ